jgi:hypothetical protein
MALRRFHPIFQSGASSTTSAIRPTTVWPIGAAQPRKACRKPLHFRPAAILRSGQPIEQTGFSGLASFCISTSSDRDAGRQDRAW